MKILFVCTAHNSLSQRLYLELSSYGYDVSVEYAISDQTIIDAVALFRPDLIICPFLTTRVPKEIFDETITLIIHPGPPGDAGPSSLDWLLMGDDGTVADASQLLNMLETQPLRPGRTHWAVTVLQAIEDFDAGPVWAFEQFEVEIDEPGLTKSELYRGAVTKAAVTATLTAVKNIQQASKLRRLSVCASGVDRYSPCLRPESRYAKLSVTDQRPFQGGVTRSRPLLKAAHRDFDVTKHTADQISRRIRSADSQPGVLSKVFGQSLYIYSGTSCIVEDNLNVRRPFCIPGTSTKILGVRNEAVCVATAEGKGIWITHLRRPKAGGPALWPKVPATICLRELSILSDDRIKSLHWPSTFDFSPASYRTFQDLWVDIDVDENSKRVACIHAEYYNGAMSTDQCNRLIEAMEYVLSEATPACPIHAVVFMGGSGYFSNGIALNVIEASSDPAEESWQNINRINDAVYYILRHFPSRSILTVACLRGNAAAGGVALAAACDIVIAGSSVVLNPAYRAMGLAGSEFHTLTYYARCRKTQADRILRDMTPLSAFQAQRIGIVDYVFPGSGEELEHYMFSHISMLLKPGCLTRGFWKSNADLSSASLARVRSNELSEMIKDFWSPRSVRYHGRRFDFIRKVKPAKTPLRFATHRRLCDAARLDVEETDRFDDVEYFKRTAEERLLAKLRDEIRDEMVLSSHINIPGLATSKTAKSPSNGDTEKSETLFSCYYESGYTPLTPPETPSPVESPLETKMVGSFFGRTASMDATASIDARIWS